METNWSRLGLLWFQIDFLMHNLSRLMCQNGHIAAVCINHTDENIITIFTICIAPSWSLPMEYVNIIPAVSLG